MIPSAAERIATMVRALTDVVLPAIDPANSLAQEQARLVVGQLLVLASQRDETRLDRLELSSELELARRLLPVAPGGSASAAALAGLDVAVGTAAAASTENAASARGPLRAAIEDVVRAASADGSPSLREATWSLVFAHARAQAERSRAWFAAAGFDDRPSAPIADMIAAFAREMGEGEARP
jgi:hypothetical protein